MHSFWNTSILTIQAKIVRTAYIMYMLCYMSSILMPQCLLCPQCFCVCIHTTHRLQSKWFRTLYRSVWWWWRRPLWPWILALGCVFTRSNFSWEPSSKNWNAFRFQIVLKGLWWNDWVRGTLCKQIYSVISMWNCIIWQHCSNILDPSHPLTSSCLLW